MRATHATVACLLILLVFPVTAAAQALDTEPPSVFTAVGTDTLWPPNRKMVNVGLSVMASDNGGSVFTLVGVYSDEPNGDEADATNPAAGTLELRAERDGKGDGRIYLILARSFDESFNFAHDCAVVVVPKSQNPALVAGLEAQAAAALAACKAFGVHPPDFFPLTEQVE